MWWKRADRRRAALAAVAASALLMLPHALWASGGGRYVYRGLEGEELSPRSQRSVARQWNEATLDAIRRDLARPTVHARNLYHLSVAMWDAWAAYEPGAGQVLHLESATASNALAAREEAISYAAYRVLTHRFAGSPGAAASQVAFDTLMTNLGYDVGIDETAGATPAALGNRIAAAVIAHGLTDGSNEAGDYANQFYEPVNEPLAPALPISYGVNDANRWQPLAIDFYVDQSGNVVPGGSLTFLSPEWGQVTPFALPGADAVSYMRDGFEYFVHHDPGPPPLLGTSTAEQYKQTFEMVLIWSAHLSPDDAVTWDISPGVQGNAPLPTLEQADAYYARFQGGGWGEGYPVNPVTGEAYASQLVPRGDYARVVAEYWADGPDSETPPGHWFTLLNYVSDHPLFARRWAGAGDELDPLHWDVRAYLALGGAMHDAAIAAWGVKGWYDYIRPISALRHMASLGQSSDPNAPSYHPNGINLVPGYIELITEETTQPGERHADWPGFEGEIAFRAWRGPDYVFFPDTETAGVGWILGEAWWPYQRPSFVSPPFAGYVSGHSTFSRAAAEVLSRITGSPYFPAGLGEFVCPQNDFLVFEAGPSIDVRLQWASYFDASDESALSRIWGGIHPPADDLPGRWMGVRVGNDAFEAATRYFGSASLTGDLNCDGRVDFFDIDPFVTALVHGDSYLDAYPDCESRAADCNRDGDVDFFDIDCFVALLVDN